MVEVNPILENIEILKQYAKGDRIGYIGGKVYSEEKELDYFSKVLRIPLLTVLLSRILRSGKRRISGSRRRWT